jgi:TRAP-type uncharacterized transport system fused permease subunit
VIVGWSTFFIPFLFVLEPALLFEGSLASIAWNLARNLLGIYVGTAGIVGYGFTLLSLPMRWLYGASALAILIPPNTFPGADVVDWIGLGVASVVVTYDFLRSRAARAAPQAKAS